MYDYTQCIRDISEIRRHYFTNNLFSYYQKKRGNVSSDINNKFSKTVSSRVNKKYSMALDLNSLDYLKK